ncbi:DUF421 domain-containing protein [Neobacillus dielmonensis]|uniref:DUF421 domain-containing protein n=1 Tax=Neobacillus dielmonensis TaxID=1347369 RepID=UPI0005A8F021|nr:YetF domain-containing protein [Neobacillus dielmonensis]
MNYIWEAVTILFTGFCLLRIAGKKTVAEMSGLEIITVLAIASTTGHAISETGLVKTILSLCALVLFQILIQFLTIKFTSIERLFIGKETPVIKDGKVITENLKKLRMTFMQLEARLREKGISSASDVKYASIESTGQLGYELMKHRKPVTQEDLDKRLEQLILTLQQSSLPPHQPAPSSGTNHEEQSNNHTIH